MSKAKNLQIRADTMAPHRRGLSLVFPFLLVGLIIVARFLFLNKMTFLVEVATFSIFAMGK